MALSFLGEFQEERILKGKSVWILKPQELFDCFKFSPLEKNSIGCGNSLKRKCFFCVNWFHMNLNCSLVQET